MAKTDADIGPWVTEKLRALDAEDWQPDGARGLVALRAQHRPVGGRQRDWLWALTAATALGVSVLAFSTTRALAARCVDACMDVTTRVTQLFRQEPAAGTRPISIFAPQDRTIAPPFALDDAAGRVMQLSAWQGHVVLVNFWATWCTPCVAEMPWFNEFARTYRDRGLVVVGVSVDEDGWTAVRPFADEHGIAYPLGLITREVSAAYGGLGTIPATYLVDRQGRVAAKYTGVVSRQDYEDEIARVLGEAFDRR